MEKNKVSLENLASAEYPVLLDTSTLLGYRNSNSNPANLSEKFVEAKERYDFFVLIENYIKKESNFYITPLVLAELQNDRLGSCYKKKIKKASFCENRELLKLYRQRRDKFKQQRRLYRTFQDNNKIFQLKKEEKILYDFIYTRNIGLKKKYKLSETNFDFLVSGAVLAEEGKTIALVSNKKGIFYARKDILEKKDFLFKRFKFFVRENFLDFIKIGG